MKLFCLIVWLTLFSVRAGENLIIDLNQRVLVTNSVYKYHVLWESRDLVNWSIVGVITNNIPYNRIGRKFTRIFYYTVPWYYETEAKLENPLIIFIFDHEFGGILGIFENKLIPAAGEVLCLKNDEDILDDWPWKVSRIVKKTNRNGRQLRYVYLTFP